MTRRLEAGLLFLVALLSPLRPASAQISPGPHYKLVVTTYGWEAPGYCGYSVPISNTSMRTPEWSSGCNYYSPQNTQTYGNYLKGLANTYSIDVLTGLWRTSTYCSPPCIFDNFVAAFPQNQTFTPMKVAYMAEPVYFCNAGEPALLQAGMIGWFNDVSNQQRYAWIVDKQGTNRPLMFVWMGAWAVGCESTFKTVIENVRNHYVQYMAVNPYIVATDGVAWQDDQLLRSFDALYQHGIFIPPVGSSTTTWCAMDNLQAVYDDILTLKLPGKTAYTSGQQIDYMGGTMPSFDRTRFDNYCNGGVQSHGVTYANCREQVGQVFRLARAYALPMGSQATWGTLTSFNEWPEGSTIEPTCNLGAKYPGGNYQYDFVQEVSRAFGPLNRSVDLGSSDTNNGIQGVYSCSDGATQATFPFDSCTQGFTNLRKNIMDPNNASYIYFNIDDKDVFQGSDVSWDITLEYWDSPAQVNQQIWVSYDSTSNAYKDVCNWAGNQCPKITGTGCMKTVTWHVNDAYFGNRQCPSQGAADLRVVAPTGVTHFINKVTATKYPTRGATTDPCSAGPCQFDAGGPKEWVEAAERARMQQVIGTLSSSSPKKQ